MYSQTIIKKIFIATTLAVLAFAITVFADAPSGADTFQLLTGTQTGSDNTGDGGTGDGDDLNYYYVGQQFTTTIQIKSGGASSANIWIDYNRDGDWGIPSTGDSVNCVSPGDTPEWVVQNFAIPVPINGLGTIVVNPSFMGYIPQGDIFPDYAEKADRKQGK